MGFDRSRCIKRKNHVSLYQEWEDYPQTPALTSLYPYQLIYKAASAYYLIGSTTPIGTYEYTVSGTTWRFIGIVSGYGFTSYLDGDEWTLMTGSYTEHTGGSGAPSASWNTAYFPIVFEEANSRVYIITPGTPPILTDTVYFQRTTAASVEEWERVRKVQHKDAVFEIARAIKYKTAE